MILNVGDLSDSSPFNFEYSSNRENIAGAPNITVSFSLLIAARAATGSKRGIKYNVAPLNSDPNRTTERPTAWDIGRTPRRRSLGTSLRMSAETAATNKRFR